MIAYACRPEGGGEHWLGWGWASTVALLHDVHLLTPPKFREEVERHAKDAGIEVSFPEVPRWQKAVCTWMGIAGTWIPKLLWQLAAYRSARNLHQENAFDIVHQTTFHTFRVPFSCSKLGIPSVWGPIAGGESIPAGFGRFLGPYARRERMRDRINRACLLIPGVLASLHRTSVLLVSNRTTRDFLPEKVRNKCKVLPANAVHPSDQQASIRKPVHGQTLQLLYVGNCVARRGLPIILETLRRFKAGEVRLRVVGAGEALDFWKSEASRLSVSELVEFTGNVDAETVRRFYNEADLLVFPSLRDSGGSALLESMTRGLPVMCLDWGGPAEMVDEESGIRLPVADPRQTIDALESAIHRLQHEPEWGSALARNARSRALSLYTWEGKRKVIENVYDGILDQRR